ncbi:MAG: ABC transporter ATP-binding protein [Candidatus Aminicenantes bacterium]|nr:ABC transporter ATP-binding protein [Candidatus Aminicenantes bacterium]
MDVLVEVKNAAFSYDSKSYIFENTTFSVNRGQILSILGPNGCGKTTMLKCIDGLFQLNRGGISIEGKNIKAMKRNEIGKKIGYVAQKQDMTFPFTVLEMVVMGRAPHLNVFYSPSEKDIRIAKEIIESLDLSHLEDRPYTNISGGQAQLALIARALCADPDVLLLDEPTSHLDFKNQRIILKVLDRLCREKGITVIMATHFPDHALAISSRALLMNHGKAAIVGDTANVITEGNLRDVFEIDVRILTYKASKNLGKTVVPL